MAIPSKPEKPTVDEFVKGAKATQADSSQNKDSKERGRPSGPEKKQLPVRLPLGLMKTIRENAGGNISFFTEKVFREHFERNNIKVDD